jgi:hypothetical protein
MITIKNKKNVKYKLKLILFKSLKQNNILYFVSKIHNIGVKKIIKI